MKFCWSFLVVSLAVLFQNCGAFRGSNSSNGQLAPTISSCDLGACLTPGFVEVSKQLDDGSILTAITDDPAPVARGFGLVGGISVAPNGNILIASQVSGAFRIYNQNFSLVKNLQVFQTGDDFCFGCDQTIKSLDDQKLYLGISSKRTGIYDFNSAVFQAINLPVMIPKSPSAPSGSHEPTPTPAPIPLLDFDSPVAVSKTGTIYLVGKNDLFSYRPSNQQFINLATNLQLSSSASLALGADSDLYVFVPATQKILHYRLDGTKIGEIPVVTQFTNLLRSSLGYDLVHSALILLHMTSTAPGVYSCGISVIDDHGAAINSKDFSNVTIDQAGTKFCGRTIHVQPDGTVWVGSEHQILKLKSGYWL